MVCLGSMSGQVHHLPVAHATFGDDVIGELLHVGAASLEHCHLHATVVIQMNVQRCLREIVVIVEVGA